MSVRIEEFRGVERLYCAELTEVKKMDENGQEFIEEVYGKPFQLAGVQEISSEVTESSETHYYDNVGAIVVDSEGDDTYTLTVSIPALRTRAILEGVTYDAKTGALVGTPKVKKYYAIGFVGNKLNGEDDYIWILKGKFTGGAETHTTRDDGTDATNIQYTFTSIHSAQEYDEVPDADGNPQKVKYYKVSANDRVDVSKWFDAVVTPASVQDILFPELDAEIAVVAPQKAEEGTWYLGKNGSDLMSADTAILEGGKVVGTLKRVTGFTEFNTSVPAEQNGYYFGFKLTKQGENMTFIKNGVVGKKDIPWEENNIFRIESTGDTFEVLVDGVSAVKFTFQSVNFE